MTTETKLVLGTNFEVVRYNHKIAATDVHFLQDGRDIHLSNLTKTEAAALACFFDTLAETL